MKGSKAAVSWSATVMFVLIGAFCSKLLIMVQSWTCKWTYFVSCVKLVWCRVKSLPSPVPT